MGLSPWRMCVVEHPATDTPSLLVRTDFTSTTYQVLITDLTHMWKESLGRREIIRRALEDDTSIDPSEDAAQMSILLGKIQAGLQGHHQTTLRVDRSLSTDLRLTVTSALPAPLPPLRWHMLLHRQPQTFLTAELTLPLLASHAKQQDQIRSLIVHLKDKDHVIGKLVDKLEASGMEIGAVFPMAVGARPTKKSSSRNVASKFVKGLSIFDQDDWRSQTKASNAPTQHLGDILRSFTHDAEALPSTSPTMLKVAKDEWWKSSEPQNTGTFGHLEPTHSSEDDDVRNAKPSRWPSVDEDDTSQRRSSHVPLPALGSPALVAQGDDTRNQPFTQEKAPATSSGQGQSHGVSAAASNHRSSTQSHGPQPVRKIGKIGGSHRRVNNSSTLSSNEHPHLAMAGAEELDEDGGGDRGNPGGAEQSPRVGSISFKDKDGRIEPKKQEPKKLGVIGRGLKSKPQVGADVSIATAAKTLDEQPRLHQNRAQELETDPKQPTVEETEEQKADRKRAELKRQLEEKTKTQGRKKRRF